MKLHFESNQQYHGDTIHAITDMFEEQPLASGDYAFT